MLIIRKNEVNNMIATVSMNKTLPNPYYLFSFQHIASKERISFYPQVITSNVRYDKFRFVEASTTVLTGLTPQVNFEYLGQYYYSIYENITSASTNIALAYNKLESGRAWVIVGDDNSQECFFEPYISNDEDFAQVIYVSEEEQECQQPLPSPTPTSTNTSTPTPTPTLTPTPTCGTFTTQYVKGEILPNGVVIRGSLWNDAGFTSSASAICQYDALFSFTGSMGTVVVNQPENFLTGEHNDVYNASSQLQPMETLVNVVINSVIPQCPCVSIILPT